MSYEVKELTALQFLKQSVTYHIDQYLQRHWAYYMEDLLNTPEEELESVLEDKLKRIFDEDDELWVSMTDEELPELSKILLSYVDREFLIQEYKKAILGEQRRAESDWREFIRWKERGNE